MVLRLCRQIPERKFSMSTPEISSRLPNASSSEKSSPICSRMVVKAGTSLLTQGTDQLSEEIMEMLVGQISNLYQDGMEIILVSSGAVSAGRHVLKISRDEEGLPIRQVLAAVGQSRLMHAYEQLFRIHGITVAQALLSRRDLSDRLGYLNVRNTLLALLERKVVPIINENDVVAVDELAGEIFGDNDTLSAMVANLVDADLLVMLGDVEGLFTSDPNMDPGARLISKVKKVDESIQTMGGPSWDDRGQGGMATKLEAAKLATVSGIDVVIASGLERDVLPRLAYGEDIGTLFPAASTKMESRTRWMLSGLSIRGEILVDNGAVDALCHKNRSLLPAGVMDVTGTFERGDIVPILDSKRSQIGCGIANYGSVQLSKIKGLHSNRIFDVLGQQYGDEIIHRNNLVIL